MDTVEGATLDEKQDKLGRMDVDTFMKLCIDVGFYVLLEAKTAVLIPGKFAYVVVNRNEAPCLGVKWSVTKVKKRVQDSVTSLALYTAEHGKNPIVTKVEAFLSDLLTTTE